MNPRLVFPFLRTSEFFGSGKQITFSNNLDKEHPGELFVGIKQPNGRDAYVALSFEQVRILRDNLQAWVEAHSHLKDTSTAIASGSLL